MHSDIFTPDVLPESIGEVAKGEKVYQSENKRELPTLEVLADNIFFNWKFSRFFMGRFGDGAVVGFTIVDGKVAFYFGAERQPNERYIEFVVSIEPQLEGYLLRLRNAAEREKMELLIGAMVSTYKTAPKFTLRFDTARGEENFWHKRAWKLQKKLL